MSQRRQDLPLGDEHARFDLGLVAWLGHARGHDHAAVVGGQLGIGCRDLGLVAVGLLHAGLQVVGHDKLGGTTEVLEGPRVGIEEALRALVCVGAGEGVVGEAQDGEEEVSLPDLAGLRIDVGHGVAGPVDEELLAGLVVLTHDEVDAAPPGAVALGIPGVAVALGVLGAILEPDLAQGEVLVGAQLLVHARPVRLARVAYRLVAVTVEALLELCVGDALRQRPGKACQISSGEEPRDGRVRDADGAGDGAPR